MARTVAKYRRRFRKRFKRRFKKGKIERKIDQYFPLALETRPAQSYGSSVVQTQRSNINLLSSLGFPTDDQYRFAYRTDMKNDTYLSFAITHLVNWTEHIDLPGLVAFYNVELKYMRLNVTINQPVTYDKVKYEFMGVVCPIIPVEDTLAGNRGQARMSLLNTEVIKQFGGTFHDQMVPKRLKPQHREMAVVWKKSFFISNRHGPGSTGLKAGSEAQVTPGAAGITDDYLQTSNQCIVRDLCIKKSFGSKMRFAVYSNAGTWIPGLPSSGTFYFFWGGDRTTPLLYFIMCKVSHAGVSFQPVPTPATIIPPGPIPTNYAGNTSVTSYINQRNATISMATTYYSWYRNENPGTLTNPTSGPTPGS